MTNGSPLDNIFEDTEVAFSNLSDKEIKKARWLFSTFNHPFLLKTGTGLTNLAFRLNLPVSGLIKKTIFPQFCGGETLQECASPIGNLSNHRIFTCLENSVEAKSTESEFEKTTAEILNSICFSALNPNIKIISCKITGIGRFDLFERLHRNEQVTQTDRDAFEKVRQRMHRICTAATDSEVSIFFDAEESWIQNPLDSLIDEMMLAYNSKRAVVYNTFQLYLTDRLHFLKTSFEKLKAANVILGAKLVRGAYLEKERERAGKMNYPSPVQPDKLATDKAYNEALEFCLKNIREIAVYAATHNENSCRLLLDMMEHSGIEKNHPHIYFSQLYGMGEHLTYNLAQAGYNATKLIPYGPVREAIPYLIRRAHENSSVAGQVGRELQLLEKEIRRRGI